MSGPTRVLQHAELSYSFRNCFILHIWPTISISKFRFHVQRVGIHVLSDTHFHTFQSGRMKPYETLPTTI